MKFVTKEEFDKAVAVIDMALSSGQVSRALHEQEPYQLNRLIFEQEGDMGGGSQFTASQVSLMAPEKAIQIRLFQLRNDLKKHKFACSDASRVIGNLETLEKELVNALALLKKE